MWKCGTEAAQFLFWENTNRIFFAVRLVLRSITMHIHYSKEKSHFISRQSPFNVKYLFSIVEENTDSTCKAGGGRGHVRG
jgi:hypothetical protein